MTNRSSVAQGELFTAEEAARRLGVKLKTVYRFIEDGELPATRVGRRHRVSAEDLDRFLDRCRVKPGELGHLFAPREI